MSKLFVEVHDGGDVTVEDCFGGSGLYYLSHFGIQVYADKNAQNGDMERLRRDSRRG